MKNIRIRGMFASALTKLAQDFGFTIVDPSDVVKERFELQQNYEPYQLELRDNEKRGISVCGKPEYVREFVNKLREIITHTVIRETNVEINSIYKGRVLQVDYNKNAVYVDLGRITVFLPFSNTTKRLMDADEVVVQVKELPFSKRMPIVNMKYSVSNDYAITIQTDEVRVSNKIEGRKRTSLLELGKKIKGIGNGLIWRTAALSLDTEDLIEEVDDVKGKYERIEKSTIRAPNKLLDGKKYVQIDFSADSKRQLDEIRRQVMPTLAGHHKYKSGTDDISIVIDIMETFKDIIPDENKLIKKFEDSLRYVKGPRVGQKFFLEHLKLNGAKYTLKGTIKEVSDNKIIIRRDMYSEGVYDGLNIKKDRDDYAITTIEEDSWYYTNEYFSVDGKLKGAYLNINTPIEVYPDRARYIDLEIDVVKMTDGDIALRDEEELKKAYNAGQITEDLFNKAMEVAKELQK